MGLHCASLSIETGVECTNFGPDFFLVQIGFVPLDYQVKEEGADVQDDKDGDRHHFLGLRGLDCHLFGCHLVIGQDCTSCYLEFQSTLKHVPQ